MPSWGIHLATSYEIANKLKINDTNSFMIGNFLPDAERYVIKDFSIFVPYNISHFAKQIEINNVKEKLPDYNRFMEKYRGHLDNPIVLGYLTHLITDYYWNFITFSKYTAFDKKGNVIGVLLDENKLLKGDKETRRILKQKDFSNFTKKVIQTKKYELPSLKQDIMKEVEVLEETKYNLNDIEKITDFLRVLQINKKKEKIDKYEMFTEEKLNKYYDESIEFIIDKLRKIL